MRLSTAQTNQPTLRRVDRVADILALPAGTTVLIVDVYNQATLYALCVLLTRPFLEQNSVCFTPTGWGWYETSIAAPARANELASVMQRAYPIFIRWAVEGRDGQVTSTADHLVRFNERTQQLLPDYAVYVVEAATPVIPQIKEAAQHRLTPVPCTIEGVTGIPIGSIVLIQPKNSTPEWRVYGVRDIVVDARTSRRTTYTVQCDVNEPPIRESAGVPDATTIAEMVAEYRRKPRVADSGDGYFVDIPFNEDLRNSPQQIYIITEVHSQIKEAASQLHYEMAGANTGNPDGFRYVDHADADFAMLFRWNGSMVMDHVTLPLSAAFIDEYKRIVDIVDMAPEPEADVVSKQYKGSGSYVWVLEVQAGWFTQHGWGVGTQLNWDFANIWKEQTLKLSRLDRTFKVGDHVRFHEPGNIWDGATGIIVATDEQRNGLVTLDNPSSRIKQLWNGFSAMELLAPTPPQIKLSKSAQVTFDDNADSDGPERLCGKYTAYGYVIEDAEDGEEIYQAGNSRWESTTEVVLRGHDAQIYDIATIGQMCAQSLAETCEERGAENGGCWHDVDTEDSMRRVYHDPPRSGSPDALPRRVEDATPLEDKVALLERAGLTAEMYPSGVFASVDYGAWRTTLSAESYTLDYTDADDIDASVDNSVMAWRKWIDSIRRPETPPQIKLSKYHGNPRWVEDMTPLDVKLERIRRVPTVCIEEYQYDAYVGGQPYYRVVLADHTWGFTVDAEGYYFNNPEGIESVTAWRKWITDNLSEPPPQIKLSRDVALDEARAQYPIGTRVRATQVCGYGNKMYVGATGTVVMAPERRRGYLNGPVMNVRWDHDRQIRMYYPTYVELLTETMSSQIKLSKRARTAFAVGDRVVIVIPVVATPWLFAGRTGEVYHLGQSGSYPLIGVIWDDTGERDPGKYNAELFEKLSVPPVPQIKLSLHDTVFKVDDHVRVKQGNYMRPGRSGVVYKTMRYPKLEGWGAGIFVTWDDNGRFDTQIYGAEDFELVVDIPQIKLSTRASTRFKEGDHVRFNAPPELSKYNGWTGTVVNNGESDNVYIAWDAKHAACPGWVRETYLSVADEATPPQIKLSTKHEELTPKPLRHVLCNDVLHYILGPVEQTWGKDKVEKLLDLPTFVVTAHTLDEAVNQPGDFATQGRARSLTFFPETSAFYTQGPHIVIPSDSIDFNDGAALIHDLAHALHYVVCGDWPWPEPSPTDTLNRAHELGIPTHTGIKHTLPELLRIQWWYDPKERAAIMETVQYLRHIGWDDNRIKNSLKSLVPESVQRVETKALDELIDAARDYAETLQDTHNISKSAAVWRYPEGQLTVGTRVKVGPLGHTGTIIGRAIDLMDPDDATEQAMHAAADSSFVYPFDSLWIAQIDPGQRSLGQRLGKDGLGHRDWWILGDAPDVKTDISYCYDLIESAQQIKDAAPKLQPGMRIRVPDRDRGMLECTVVGRAVDLLEPIDKPATTWWIAQSPEFDAAWSGKDGILHKDWRVFEERPGPNTPAYMGWEPITPVQIKEAAMLPVGTRVRYVDKRNGTVVYYQRHPRWGCWCIGVAWDDELDLPKRDRDKGLYPSPYTGFTRADTPQIKDAALYSVISVPKHTLDPTLWELSDPPTLKKDVRDELITRLLDFLANSGYNHAPTWLAQVILVGSSTGNQYDDTADLDVTLVIDFDQFREQESSPLENDEITHVLGKLLVKELNDKPYADTRHPVNYYARADLVLDSADAVYDLYNDKWMKPPQLIPDDFDPEVSFPHAWRKAQQIATEFDMELGQLKRDVVDYEYYRHALKLDVNRDALAARIEDKLKEVEVDIDIVISDYRELRHRRLEAFTRDPEELRDVWMASRNWMPENLEYKWLEKWRYLKLLHFLQELWENVDRSAPERIEDVADALDKSAVTNRPITTWEQLRALVHGEPVALVSSERTWRGTLDGFDRWDSGHVYIYLADTGMRIECEMEWENQIVGDPASGHFMLQVLGTSDEFILFAESAQPRPSIPQIKEAQQSSDEDRVERWRSARVGETLTIQHVHLEQDYTYPAFTVTVAALESDGATTVRFKGDWMRVELENGTSAVLVDRAGYPAKLDRGVIASSPRVAGFTTDAADPTPILPWSAAWDSPSTALNMSGVIETAGHLSVSANGATVSEIARVTSATYSIDCADWNILNAANRIPQIKDAQLGETNSKGFLMPDGATHEVGADHYRILDDLNVPRDTVPTYAAFVAWAADQQLVRYDYDYDTAVLAVEIYESTPTREQISTITAARPAMWSVSFIDPMTSRESAYHEFTPGERAQLIAFLHTPSAVSKTAAAAAANWARVIDFDQLRTRTGGTWILLVPFGPSQCVEAGRVVGGSRDALRLNDRQYIPDPLTLNQSKLLPQPPTAPWRPIAGERYTYDIVPASVSADGRIALQGHHGNEYAVYTWTGLADTAPPPQIKDAAYDAVGLYTPKQAQQMALTDVIQTAEAASVIIYGTLGDTKWSGSGARISEDIVLTCAHVCNVELGSPLDPATEIDLSFDGKTFTKGTIVALHNALDIAVIRISDAGMLDVAGPPLPIGRSTQLVEGQQIFAVGAPEGVRSIVSVGYVGSDPRRIPELQTDVFFINLEIHPGSSGGPVLDTSGHIVGIARGSIGTSADAPGLNYCVAVDPVKFWLHRWNIPFTEN